MSFLFRSAKAQDRSSDSGDQGETGAGPEAAQRGGAGLGASMAELRGLLPAATASAGSGPSYLNPVTPTPWLPPGDYHDPWSDMRGHAAREDAMAGAPGDVLHSGLSVGSSGYSSTQVNGPGAVQDASGVHTSTLTAQSHLRTQGSETHARLGLGEMSAQTGDNPRFSVSAGSADLLYNGQHTRGSASAQGPSSSIGWGSDGPSMSLSAGSASASGTATAAGDRWGLTGGFSASLTGPGARLGLGGFSMNGLSTGFEGGFGLSRRRDEADPASAEQVASLTRSIGGLPNLNVNPDALLHIAQDNPEAIEAIGRGLAEASMDDLGAGLGADHYDRLTGASTEDSGTTEDSGSGGGLWGFVSSIFSGGGGGSGGSSGSGSRFDRDDGSSFDDWSSSPSSDSSSSDSSSSDSSSSDSSSSDSSSSDSSSSDSSSSDSSSSPYDSAESSMDYFSSISDF